MSRNISFSRYSTKSIEEVFQLISSYSNYKYFIPGCSDSKIISVNGNSQIGELDFEIFEKKYSIQSQNIIDGFNIEIDQIKGPFDNFRGKWILDREDGKTLIKFEAIFKLPFLINAVTPDSLIKKFSQTIINSFIAKLS